MNLWIRLFWVLLSAWRGAALDVLGTSRLHLRVLPHDLDLNFHMNNGRYLTLMDLGRLDLVARSGLGRAVLRHRWQPIVAGLTMRFRRPLAPFQKFVLETQVVAWDDQWVYLEQRFVTTQGEVAARGVLRTTFVGRSGRVPSGDILAAVGYAGDSPPLPEWVAGLAIG